MKFAKIIIFNVLFALLLSVGASAASKYIVDDAKVLKQDTITTVEQNLNKIEENTEVTIKFDIIKSLNGKSIDEYAKQYAKDNISGDQYILFVSSIGDKKNKLLVGEKANNILSKSEIENIVSLPNQDFKSNNFDVGIIKVGKSLDEKYNEIRNRIVPNREGYHFFDLLDFCRQLIKNQGAGYNVLRYLLHHMNNRVIKEQYHES